MIKIADTYLPDELKITSVERNIIGESNDVFFCHGEFEGRPLPAYIKVSTRPNPSLANERAILDRLALTQIPVPRVLWYGDLGKEVLILEALPGAMIWDYIDPRRELYHNGKVLSYLHTYGEYLGRIHNLSIEWPLQKRPRLYGFIGEENVEDDRFRRLVLWLQGQDLVHEQQTFVHGDFNTASMLLHNGAISGVIDWEFAGSGWREYDLAWVLRARTAFLNTQAEYDAILSGYCIHACYDDNALRQCEVLNYLHFAYWSKEDVPDYTSFVLQKAMDLAGLT